MILCRKGNICWDDRRPTYRYCVVLVLSTGGSPSRPVRLGIPHRGVIRHTALVSGLRIGYARVAAEGQDLTAQRNAAAALGVAPERIYVEPWPDRQQMRSPGTACSSGHRR